ncbi:uncharacterized protein LOC134299335 [Anolis carolinensis]|uniref:uncharacterized protein LOC134299335 n=1 Tax=Anolis carolinensis TaxID=28377 RepID=UPI002F2B8DB1
MLYYGRFLDDIFTIFNSYEKAQSFSDWINTIHPNMKFTSTISSTNINFLDVVVHKDGNGLYVTNYTKPTDKNSILHFKSFHHHSLKSNLPYSQLLRLKRNNSKPKDFLTAAHTFKNKLKIRGYPEKILNTALEKTNQVNRDTLLKYQSKTQSNRIICPLTLTTQTSNIQKIIFKHWHLLQDIPGCQSKPIIAHKRTRNFRDILIHSDIRKSSIVPRNPTTGNFKCGHCDCCKFTNNVKEFIHPTLNMKIKLKNYTTCSSENVIYVLSCPCNKLYVGMTTRAIRIRIQEHRSRIRKGNTESTLYLHFKDNIHSCNDLKYLALEKLQTPINTDIKKLLLCREAFWIHKLKTLTPQGLNDRLDLTCFL